MTLRDQPYGRCPPLAQQAGAAHPLWVRAKPCVVPENLWQLSDALKAGTFRPQSIRRVHIPKPGTHETRPLGSFANGTGATVRDQIVQAAVVNVIEPIFERARFIDEKRAEHSYGFRPGRSCKDRVPAGGWRRVDELLKAGHVHVVDADLKGYFDSIPHAALMNRLQTKIADGPARPDCLAAGLSE